MFEIQDGLVKPGFHVNRAGHVVLMLDDTRFIHAANEKLGVREDDLLLLGIETMRVTGPRLKREPTAVVRRVGAHLARRRRELGLN